MNHKNVYNFKDFVLKKLNESVSGSVRTRFAPSPTGGLHIGGVRTMIYNYLFAKHNNGEMYLRIEDTDTTRFNPKAEQYIYDTIDWLGLEVDESPRNGGPYGPYVQSERKDIYKKYIKEFIDLGKAYYAFDKPEDMDIARAEAPGGNFMYGHKNRLNFVNSLTLSPEEVQERLNNGEPYVVRALMPENTNITVDDIIRGPITINTNEVDDKVLYKGDTQIPTYHFASVVDDHLMKTSHVIRGTEWIASLPLHAFLYDSFGWERPQFAHLPLILGEKGKLSKRDTVDYGYPVFPLTWEGSVGYKELGFLPEATINILSFLGWNPGTEKEVYTLDELIQDFDLKRVNKSGAKFSMDKAKWFNAQHIKMLSVDEVIVLLKPILREMGLSYPDEIIRKMVEFNKDKVPFVKDIPEMSTYLFEAPTVYDEKTLRKKWKEDSPIIIEDLKNVFEGVNLWNVANIQPAFEKYVADGGYNFGQVMPILRLVLTGMGFGPSIFDIMELIGKDETINRMENYDIKK